MTWLEEIRMRSTSDRSAEVLARLEALASAGTPEDLVEQRVYVHGRIVGDLAVHLLWRAGRAPSGPTPTGRAVSDLLRQYGMVDHSIWTQASP